MAGGCQQHPMGPRDHMMRGFPGASPDTQASGHLGAHFPLPPPVSAQGSSPPVSPTHVRPCSGPLLPQEPPGIPPRMEPILHGGQRGGRPRPLTAPTRKSGPNPVWQEDKGQNQILPEEPSSPLWPTHGEVLEFPAGRLVATIGSWDGEVKGSSQGPELTKYAR